MRVDDPPVARLLAECHGRTRDEILTVGPRWTGLITEPFGAGVALAPDHREIAVDDAADIERSPIAAHDIILVVLPQPRPLLAALVGMAIEVEEHGLRRAAPDFLQLLPIEAGVGIEVLVHALEQAAAILR